MGAKHMWSSCFSNPMVPKLTGAQSKSRVAELRSQGYIVKKVKLPDGSTAVLRSKQPLGSNPTAPSFSLTWTPRSSDARGRHVLYSNVVEYGVFDETGRSIGGYAVIGIWADDTIHLRTQATRDGKTFGGDARSTRCASIEEAKKLAEKKLRTAANRYRSNPDHLSTLCVR